MTQYWRLQLEPSALQSVSWPADSCMKTSQVLPKIYGTQCGTTCQRQLNIPRKAPPRAPRRQLHAFRS